MRSVMSIRIAPKHRKQAKSHRWQYNIQRLQSSVHQEHFQMLLSEKLALRTPGDDNTSAKEDWEALKQTIHEVCEESIGLAICHHQDWFDDNNNTEITALLNQKRKASCDWQNQSLSSHQKQSSFHQLKAGVQRRIQDIKNKWWEDKAKEIQTFADRHDMWAAIVAQAGLPTPPAMSASGPVTQESESSVTEGPMEKIKPVKDHP
ncbi:uncharacterized protein LOC123343391 [Mauremys mutica]|uniref:uncharacterized protein LOC123343391 n=1 Tax=Mauremys mutica TaxID=74926 RepID=UPI001D139F3E|nr:uncharacterized protein LOC123343391 [Mauremys mutica]XP_044834441.1 uncharacterized protein LOC123343391 [Mauremys mutica]